MKHRSKIHRATRPFAPSLAILLLAVSSPLPAQQPDAATKAGEKQQRPEHHAPVELTPLPKLLGGLIHQIQPTGTPAAEASQSGAGTAKEVAVARIRDAVFDEKGALQALLVDEAERSRGGDALPFVLAQKEVRWDPDRRVLVTSLDAAGIRALPTEKAKGDKEERKTFHASELILARPRCSDSGASRMGEPPRALWFAPAAARLAYLTVQAAGKPRVLPWTIVRPAGSGEQLTLELAAPQSLVEGAPVVDDERKAPDATSRRSSYGHFASPVPDWEGKGLAESKAERRP
jgi:hypothetical protein